MHEIDNILIISIITRLALVSPEYFFGCGSENRGFLVGTRTSGWVERGPTSPPEVKPKSKFCCLKKSPKLSFLHVIEC